MWTATQALPPIQFLRRLIANDTASDRKTPTPPHLQQRSHNRCRNRQPRCEVSAEKRVGGLGQSIFAAVDSNANQQISEEKQKREEEKEISGSDVLWALKRAAAEKKKSNAERKTKKKKKKTDTEASSSASGSTGDGRVDHGNVRPLRIKAEWGPKLEEFQKLLKELQETAM